MRHEAVSHGNRAAISWLGTPWLTLPSPDALNELMYAEMSRTGAVADRFKKVHSLMGYRYWDAVVVSTIDASVAPLNDARRNAVLSLTSVDAALADPRWAALTP